MNEQFQPATMGRPSAGTGQPGATGTIETYACPRSLDEAAELLRAGNVTILAGGTDLMPQVKSGRARFQPVLMNIRRIGELAGISENNGVVRFGALTTMTELLDNSLVRNRFAALWQACDHFASDQLRNAATLGGNICNASPAGDTLVPLLVFDARVVLVSKPDGALATRSVPLAEFLTGPGRTNRLPGELLAAVEVPLPPPGFASEFYKFGTRPALDISGISIGLGAVREQDTLRDVRVAFGAVAPTPIRAPRTEAALDGKPVAAALAAALAAADGEIHPISDLRASEWYRRELVRNILSRMLSNVGER
jgi:CO/xanthine dehydrogenase FAD-binding subunit